MAEALGLAASVIAVVDVAAKTGSAYVRIQRLWREVKNVPNMLREKAEDVQIFEDFLANVEDNLALSPLPALASDRILLEKLIGRCRSALEELRDMVDMIYIRVTSERGLKHRIASTKATLRKDDLEALSLKFDRALRMFEMAQAEERRRIAIATYNAIMKSNQSGSLSSTNITASTRMNPPLQAKRDVQGDEIRSREGQIVRNIVSESSGLSLFGKFRFGFEQQGGFHAFVGAPSWLSNSVYSILARKQTMGWQFSLRAHEVVQQFDKDTRLIIRNDDCKELIKHLQSRGMGLLVHDENGGDLLSVAVSYRSLNVLGTLISLGLDVRLGDPHIGWQLIQSVVMSSLYNHHAYPAIVQMLGDNGLDDLLEADGLVWALNHGIAFNSFQDLLHRRIQGPELLFSERSRLVRAMVCRIRDTWWTLDQVLVLVPETSVRQEAWLARSRSPGHYSLLQSMAVGAMHPLLSDDCAVEQHRWAQILADYVRLDPLGLQHADRGLPYELPGWATWGFYTPLSAMIFRACLKQRFTDRGEKADFSLQLARILRFWVNILASAGIDLLQYGRLERRFHETDKAAKFRGFVSRFFPRRKYAMHSPTMMNEAARRYRIAGFTYGHLPEHWTMWITCENYEYAGDFWAMIEDQAISMPGSWVPDPVDRDNENRQWLATESPPLIWTEYRKITPPI